MTIEDAVNIRKIILSIPLGKGDFDKFEDMCRNWDVFCDNLAEFNREQVMRLMKYLLKERPNNSTLLNRSISRFNKLNKLREDMLCLRKR